jgi:GT2 family glycosyltransferase/glycosyltransferase involved in cell wall biosynthesis
LKQHPLSPSQPSGASDPSAGRPVKVLFASGSPAAIAVVLERLKAIMPELPLVIVSEFEPPEGSGREWIRYHVKRSWRENRALVRAKLGARRIRIAAVILEPRTPHWPMRLAGFTLAPLYFLAFNEHGEHFMLRPRSLPSVFRHAAWRTRNFFRSQFKTGGWMRKQMERVRHPEKIRQPVYYRLALMRGRTARARTESWKEVSRDVAKSQRPEGISVVIPSRNGFALLEQCLPRISDATEIIVVDNGTTYETTTDDRTDALREGRRQDRLPHAFPQVIIEHNAEPLSFARAVNRGIAKARYSHVCVLNNDMLAEPGFLRELRLAFDRVPDLFAATAQIFFPEGQRREETGKTVMPADRGITDFPLRCDEPVVSDDGASDDGGEDLSYVLYGSGGCTLYDARKLEALGGFDEVYEPAYVEDLDLGVRAWQRGWPSVYCAGARVLHLHRATTSRYFSPEELHRALEHNYLRFLARAIGDRSRFHRMWRENIVRLNLLEDVDALAFAARLRPGFIEDARTDFFDLVNGDVAVFQGKPASNKPRVLIASPYLPFPLAHGAAVRIYNLMRRAARDFDLVLIACVEQAGPVPRELRDICVEVVTVRRRGTHALPSTTRPDTVEEFDLPAFHAALRQTIAKWWPGIVQLEFTQMAVYAADCATAGVRAGTILVEHDITFDLYAQMLAQGEDWETRREYDRWVNFEREAWTRVDRVVVMSERDRLAVASETDASVAAGSVVIANGVDLERFQPASLMTEAREHELLHELEPRRLLFIGSFAHRPNVLAMEFFLREVFPRLKNVTVHVIAGRRHEAFWDLRHAGVEVEGFVSDVRPAYERATLVIAPLVASAGTNIKIMEAMAMGKAIVSTEAGIHGLDLERGKDVIVADSAEEMAGAIARLLDHPEERRAMELHARETAERVYGWDAVAEKQAELYRLLLRDESR